MVIRWVLARNVLDASSFVQVITGNKENPEGLQDSSGFFIKLFYRPSPLIGAKSLADRRDRFRARGETPIDPPT